MYTIDNIQELIKATQNATIDPYKNKLFKKLKKEIRVHTKGILFEKTYKLFENEDPELTRYVANSYEPITTASIWKGVNNISNIFGNTTFKVTGNERILKSFTDKDFYENYTKDWIDYSVTSDPNTISVWLFKNNEWQSKFIESEFIKSIEKDSITFIDIERSEYTIKEKTTNFKLGSLRNKEDIESYFKEDCYEITNAQYVYISKTQYIEFKKIKDNEYQTLIKEISLNSSPYSFTGTLKVSEGVYNTPLSSYIPFGNIALIQHRAFTHIERLFGYPRISEIELPCDGMMCNAGQVPCEITDDNLTGSTDCNKCGGSGSLSMQSMFNIYKKKLHPDKPELNSTLPPVQFITPDVSILEYNSNSYKLSIQQAEESLYIQQKQQTGNVESAKSRELQMSETYSWFRRLSNIFYQNLEHHITIRHELENLTDEVSIEKPLSFAIINELEAYELLQSILVSENPQFIKNSHLEVFLSRYISKGNPIHRIVQILKKVDPFALYTMKDIDILAGQNDILQDDRFIHAYAFPMLMQMISLEPDLFQKEDDKIVSDLLAKIMAKKPIDNLRQNLLNA